MTTSLLCPRSTHTPWMRLWTLMVYSLVTTSLMAERPFFFSPFLVGAIWKATCKGYCSSTWLFSMQASTLNTRHTSEESIVSIRLARSHVMT